jgi:hypothetical protein
MIVEYKDECQVCRRRSIPRLPQAPKDWKLICSGCWPQTLQRRAGDIPVFPAHSKWESAVVVPEWVLAALLSVGGDRKGIASRVGLILNALLGARPPGVPRTQSRFN